MFTIVLTLNESSKEITTWNNVVDFQINEISYVQYRLIIYWSHFPDDKDEMIIDKEQFVGIVISPERIK